MRKLILPPPPGNWRGNEFTQPFRNSTPDPVLLVTKTQSFVLQSMVEIDITWEIDKSNNDGSWKIKWPQ